MIRLIEPPSSGRVTGGYRYNAELIKRLQSTGLGTVEHVASSELAGARFAEEDVLVFDSLYLATQDPPEWLAEAPRTVLLLHYLPSLDPTCSEAERARATERESAWFAAVERVVTTSRSMAERLASRSARAVYHAAPGVGSGFRPHAGPPAGEGPCRVLVVGTITAAKGQLEIVEALAAQERPVELVLLGDDRTDEDYVRRVRDAGAGLALELPGCVPPEEVPRALQRAHLVVSGSTFESYGMAVAEAVSMGVPVVAYRAGEIGEWVVSGENGYLIEPGDRNGFDERLASLVREPERLEALRQSERRVFFPSWDYTFERFLRAAREEDFEGDGADQPEVTLYSRCPLPTHLGRFEVEVYRLEGGEEALLIYQGDLSGSDPPFVRVHSECFTGEILGSLKCDCRPQLDKALQEVARRGRGAVVYLRQEGRGIGLGNKILAYAEQEKGADTIEANERLGFPADLRDFRVAAVMLASKGVTTVALNTNNPNKVASLEANGISVQRVLPSHTDPNPHNVEYLVTKFASMGHAGLEQALGRVGALPHGGSPVGGAHANGRKPLLVFDLDGVLQHDDFVPPQGIELLRELRAEGYPLRFLTNDGINSRGSRTRRMSELGLDIEREELYTASSLTARYLAERDAGPVLALCGQPALEEFQQLELTSGPEARAVVVGDYFPHYDYEALKVAFEAVSSGAELVAMHKKRSWPTQGKRVIDIGFWVSGLEYTTGRPATIVGKPSAFSYFTVLADAGYRPEEAIMISDEEDPDLAGAREAGLRTLLVRPDRAALGAELTRLRDELARV